MSNWTEPKNDYTAGDEVVPAIFNTLAENERYLKEKEDTKITTDDVKNAVINNTTSSTRTNLTASEILSSGFAKIRKWFTDLKALAFKDTVSSIDIDSSAVTTEKIAASAVNESKISDSAVTCDKISDNAVTTVKIADLAVTNAKISEVLPSKIIGLKTIATTGSYNDLTDKPAIPEGVVIEDNLISASATSALSANQGKILSERLTALGFKAGTMSFFGYSPQLNKLGNYVIANFMIYGMTNMYSYVVTMLNGKNYTNPITIGQVQESEFYPKNTYRFSFPAGYKITWVRDGTTYNVYDILCINVSVSTAGVIKACAQCVTTNSSTYQGYVTSVERQLLWEMTASANSQYQPYCGVGYETNPIT